MSRLNKCIVGCGLVLELAYVFVAPLHDSKLAGPSNHWQTTAQSSGKSFEGTAKAHLIESYGKLPLSFEANQGQAGKHVKFLTRGPGYMLLLTEKEAMLSLSSRKPETGDKKEETSELSFPTRPSPMAADAAQVTTSVLRMKLAGASLAARPIGVDELPGKVNYFIGNDPKNWRTNIPTYAKIRYKNVYPGIDLVYYGNQAQLEYDFVVAPGADPGNIALAFEGSTDRQGFHPPRIDEKGNVLIESGSSILQLNQPVIYQARGSETGAAPKSNTRNSKRVDGHFVLTASNRIRFELGPYDKSQPLIIDPALVYSTFLGGTTANSSAGVSSMAVDSSGNAFLSGGASSPFPTTAGAFDTNTEPHFIAKMNPTGSALIYSTFFGSLSETALCGEFQGGIALDSSNNAYLTGYTTATDFPVTTGAFQTKLGNPQGCSAFVTKLNNTGSNLVYSTYLGGTNGLDIGFGITVDSSGNAYVAGQAGSTDFPTNNAIQSMYGGGQSDAFVTELNPNGNGLVFSTFLGGTAGDAAGALAIDGAGAIYVGGSTSSSDFPTKNPLQATNKGSNAFITKLAPGGSSLVYSTYLGGSGTEFTFGLVVDGLGNAYVGGQTLSPDFPTVKPFQASCPSTHACLFAAKVNSAGSALIYSTYLGGSGSQGQFGRVFAVDASGNAYLAGQTWAPDFPLLNPIQTTYGGNADAFVTVLDPTGSALVFSTYLGGSGRDRNGSVGLDSAGHLYVAGVTESTDFPVLPGAMQASFTGGSAAFISKIDLSANANPDFLVLPAPNSLSVTPPATGTFNVNVMPLGSFNQTVNIICTGAPSKSTCTPSPSSVTLNGTDTAAVTVNISTNAAKAALVRTPNFSLFAVAVFTLPMGLLAFSLAGSRRRSAVRPALFVLAPVLLSLTFLPSCGGGSGGTPPPPPPGPQPGTYTLTVTGTSGNLSHSTTISLTVN